MRPYGEDRRRLKLFLIYISCAVFFISMPSICELVYAKDDRALTIELAGDNIYLGGQKFLIKGIGYSPYRPGQWPGEKIPLSVIETDFIRIKEAGFNTIRVWGIMPEEQLGLAEKYGLKVIQAAGLKPNADFGYSGYVRQAESMAKMMCSSSKKHANVIMYLVMNEPHADSVIKSGVDNTLNLYRRLAAIIKEEDPGKPVSMANAFWTVWLDQSMWDVVSFNTYSYWPPIAADIGYDNFVENIKSLHAPNKPFAVTEFGYSVSPKGDGKGNYGGNTEDEQAEGIIRCFRGLIEGGAAGGCVFEWNDEWWKEDKPYRHDEGPEEWFGIVGIEDTKNTLGTPRKAYYSLQDELKLIITEPKNGHRMLDKADIEANASPSLTGLRYRIDNGGWLNLEKNGEWWRGTLDSSGLNAGLHILTVKGTEGGKEIKRELNIIKCKDEKDLLPPLSIELTTDKPSYKNGDEAEIKVCLKDRDGLPIKNHYVKIGIFNTLTDFVKRWEGYTGDDGAFSKKIPVVGRYKEWYYIYWAGAEAEDYGYKRKEGKFGYVRANIGEGFPLKWLTAKKSEKIEIDGIMEEEWLKANPAKLDLDTCYSEGSISGADDLSAEVRMLWDSDNLYLLADITDNIAANNKFAKGEIWRGDCVELFVSLDPGKIPYAGYSNADFQILIGANGQTWIPGQAKGGVRNDSAKSSKTVVKKSDKGYILETKINISNFCYEPFRIFKINDILGFDVAIGDADETGEREGKIIWNGTGEGYKDSAVWGRLKLE